MNNLTTTGKHVVKQLRCDLSDEEKLRKAEGIGHKINDLTKIQTAKKESASSYKAQEERVDGEVKDMARALASGYEMRDVECRILMDYTEATVSYERCDTNEIVETRRMTVHERQMRLPLDEESGIDTVTLSSGGKSVTLTKEDYDRGIEKIING